MSYLILLALVLTIAFATLLLQHAVPKKSAPWLVFSVGYILLVASLTGEIVLAFEFQDWAVRGFYLARNMLAVAWLGQGYVLLNWPKIRYLNYATWGLIVVSLVSLVMTASTQITRAEDWFSPSQTIYWQLGELLATNRPIRWGGLLLNLYGIAALVGGAGHAYLVGNKKEWVKAASPAFIIAGTLLLIFPIYWPPKEIAVLFLCGELFSPIFIFLGVSDVFNMNGKPRNTAK